MTEYLTITTEKGTKTFNIEREVVDGVRRLTDELERARRERDEALRAIAEMEAPAAGAYDTTTGEGPGRAPFAQGVQGGGYCGACGVAQSDCGGAPACVHEAARVASPWRPVTATEPAVGAFVLVAWRGLDTAIAKRSSERWMADSFVCLKDAPDLWMPLPEVPRG